MGGVRSSRMFPLRNGDWSRMMWYTPSDLITTEHVVMWVIIVHPLHIRAIYIKPHMYTIHVLYHVYVHVPFS